MLNKEQKRVFEKRAAARPNWLQIAADHRNTCRCDDCKIFAALLADSDVDEDGHVSYHPFTEAELAAEADKEMKRGK